jgi:hypothetical protein
MGEDIVKRINPSSISHKLYVISNRIVILGPELLHIEINTQRDIKYVQFSVNVYTDKVIKGSRDNYYDELLSILELKNNKEIKVAHKIKKYETEFKSETDRIYCFFYMASLMMKNEATVFATISKESNKFTEDGKTLLKKQINHINKYDETNFS